MICVYEVLEGRDILPLNRLIDNSVDRWGDFAGRCGKARRLGKR